MRIDVALLPGQAHEIEGSVCAVVDVLRASSTIVTLLEQGTRSVVAAAGIAEARRLKARLPGHLLCGEQNGPPPVGFDYGNSPSEFSCLDLAGKSAILATSNGTRVLAAVSRAPAVLVGCLLNRAAVAGAAVHIAQERDLDITVICSAAHGGSAFVLEDALGAGAIVDTALRYNLSLATSDAARFARDAFATAEQRIGEAVASAYHARELIEAGLAEDVEYCARLDTSHTAPLLERGEDGLLILNRAVLQQR